MSDALVALEHAGNRISGTFAFPGSHTTVIARKAIELHTLDGEDNYRGRIGLIVTPADIHTCLVSVSRYCKLVVPGDAIELGPQCPLLCSDSLAGVAVADVLSPSADPLDLVIESEDPDPIEVSVFIAQR